MPYRFRQGQPTQKIAQVVGQRDQLQTSLVVFERAVELERGRPADGRRQAQAEQDHGNGACAAESVVHFRLPAPRRCRLRGIPSIPKAGRHSV